MASRSLLPEKPGVVLPTLEAFVPNDVDQRRDVGLDPLDAQLVEDCDAERVESVAL
jgi:hypothetical protein